MRWFVRWSFWHLDSFFSHSFCGAGKRKVGARVIQVEETFGDHACHLESSEGSGETATQILRCSQDDRPDPSQARSREVFSPNVYKWSSSFFPWLPISHSLGGYLGI